MWSQTEEISVEEKSSVDEEVEDSTTPLKSDFSIEMAEDQDYEKENFFSEVWYLTEKDQKLLYLDFKDPEAMARDVLLDHYSNRNPNSLDFSEAVGYIMNTAKYIERIELLVNYERRQFLEQRPEQRQLSENEETTPSEVKSLKSETIGIHKGLPYDSSQVICGQHLLLLIENPIEATEGKVGLEEDEDYHFRRGQLVM